MKPFIVFILSVFLTTVSAQDSINTYKERIVTTIDSSQANNLVLIQEFKVQVPLDSVWNTYTTKKGWESAFTTKAEVNFKINGTIKTNYNKDGVIGDSATITLHIKNYIPKKLITLQAELTPHFPEFMKADAKDFHNIITFESLDTNLTKVVSYGIGYKNTKKYLDLMAFFTQGNALSYANLMAYLETGIPAKY